MVIVLVMAGVACGRTFTGMVVDGENKPVAGALVYMEMYTRGTYDFCWTVSGKKGELPGEEYPQLRCAMRPGAKLTYAVFAPGKLPLVINTRHRVPKKKQLTLIVDDTHLRQLRLAYNPDLFHLDFPFEKIPVSHKKLQQPENRLLLEKLSWEYEKAEQGADGLSPEAVKKIEALRNLMPRSMGKNDEK